MTTDNHPIVYWDICTWHPAGGLMLLDEIYARTDTRSGSTEDEMKQFCKSLDEKGYSFVVNEVRDHGEVYCGGKNVAALRDAIVKSDARARKWLDEGILIDG